MARTRKSPNVTGRTVVGDGAETGTRTGTGTGTSSEAATEPQDLIARSATEGTPRTPVTASLGLVIEEPEPDPARVKEREANRKSRARKREAAEVADAAENSAQQAALLVTLIDSVIASQVGPDAAMNEAERAMIVEPLGRIIARASSETRGMIDRWADPMALTLGLITWGGRVWSVAETTAKTRARGVVPLARPVVPQQPAMVHRSEPETGEPEKDETETWTKARAGLVTGMSAPNGMNL